MEQDFTLWAGDTKTYTITVTDGNNNPINLTGAQRLLWALIDTVTDKVILIKTLAAGQIAVTNGVAGIFTVALAEADTINLGGAYGVECRVVTSTGESGIVFSGMFTINKAHI